MALPDVSPPGLHRAAQRPQVPSPGPSRTTWILIEACYVESVL
jgi:hypothetical protein